MKVSEVKVNDIVNYLKLDEGEYIESNIQMLIDTARAFIRSYTGLNDALIDTHEDITIVLYVLCQDMHDNRAMYVDKNNINRLVKTILNMHRINFLPSLGV